MSSRTTFLLIFVDEKITDSAKQLRISSSVLPRVRSIKESKSFEAQKYLLVLVPE